MTPSKTCPEILSTMLAILFNYILHLKHINLWISTFKHHQFDLKYLKRLTFEVHLLQSCMEPSILLCSQRNGWFYLQHLPCKAIKLQIGWPKWVLLRAIQGSRSHKSIIPPELLLLDAMRTPSLHHIKSIVVLFPKNFGHVIFSWNKNPGASSRGVVSKMKILSYLAFLSFFLINCY